MSKKPKDRECFVMVEGKQTDAPIHDIILAGGDGEAEKIGRALAAKSGLTQQEIDLLFPK